MTAMRKMHRRDPATERLWFSVTTETHNDLGEPFAWPKVAVRHHGEIVAFYGGSGTLRSAIDHANGSIADRVAALCGGAA